MSEDAISPEERARRDRAIAVARDVLEHLDALRLIQGRYVYEVLSEWDAEEETEIEKDRSVVPLASDLRDVVDEVQKHCEVCLLGACLLSKARLFDEVPLADIRDREEYGEFVDAGTDKTLEFLKDVFSIEQQRLMEAAFERDFFLGRNDAPRGLLRGAVKFSLEVDPITPSYHPSRKVVRAVMENVIANDGVFVVEPCDEEVDLGEL